MLRFDLATARQNWLDAADGEKDLQERTKTHFLLSTDEAGRVLDFHALRHTFITNLARGGVHPKLAQDLARHSDINLTLSRYSHTVIGDLSEALTALPDISAPPAERATHRATGTMGAARPEHRGASAARAAPPSKPASRGHRQPSALTLFLTGAGDATGRGMTAACAVTPDGARKNRVEQPPIGLEPMTCGLQNRCSTN